MTDQTFPSGNAVAVTPSDTVDLTTKRDGCRALYVGVAGDIAAVLPTETVITLKNAVAGTILPVRCVRVNATDTTATDLVALF